ncbi:MAG: hypothetical protein AB7D57_06230 [Desulfovibrionaceae bacterium]
MRTALRIAVLGMVLALSLALLACSLKSKPADESAESPAAQADAPKKKGGNNEEPKKCSGGSLAAMDVTPFTRYADLDANATDNATATDDSPRCLYDNVYTRLHVTSSTPEWTPGDATNDKGVRPMLLNKQGFWAKLFSRNKCNISLEAKVIVGNYTETIPLVSVMHLNDSQGEFWSQSVSHTMLAYPVFLVRGDSNDSVPIMEVTLKGTDKTESTGAAMLLQTALASIQTVSPQAKMLTTLTAQGTTEKANAIDATLSRLFTNGITEAHISHRDLRYAQDDNGIQISLSVPETECDWNSELWPVGTWVIGFDAPRPSVFSNWRICKEDKPQILCAKDRATALNHAKKQLKDNPGQVLNFQIKDDRDQGTIRSYLTQLPWYVSGEAALNGNATNDVAVSDSLCKNIANEVQALGFNTDDAAFVVQAVINGLPHNSRRHEDAFQQKFCATMVAKAKAKAEPQPEPQATPPAPAATPEGNGTGEPGPAAEAGQPAAEAGQPAAGGAANP